MKRLAKTTLMTAMVAMVSFSIYAQTGRDIAQRVKDRPDGDTRRSELTMKLINKLGAVREARKPCAGCADEKCSKFTTER